MKRGWNRMFVSLVLSGIAVFGAALNARGAPPAPSPTGTIYYRSASAIGAVKADGSGHTQNLLPNFANLALPVVNNANPAFYRSGGNSTHDRWFLYFGTTGTYDEYYHPSLGLLHDVDHKDLFAVRSNPANRSQLITVQLTDLYGIVMFDSYTGWSNDDNDGGGSFVTALARDLRGGAYEELEDPETGEIITSVDTTLSVQCTPRLPLTISELDLGEVLPISPDTISETELDAIVAFKSIVGPRLDFQGTFSPDGSQCLRATTPRLEIASAVTGSPVQLLWNGSSAAPNVLFGNGAGHQWSPNGATIAIVEILSAYPRGGNIWTQPANASTAPKKVLSATTSGSTKTTYSNPVWSPDNQYLVALKLRYSGTALNGAWLTRMKLSDGKTADLVSLPTTSVPCPLRWVSND